MRNFDIDKKKLDIIQKEAGTSVQIWNSDREMMKHVYFSITKSGKIRGNHYHKKKTEWMCVVKGRARIALEEIRTGKRQSFNVSGKRLVLIKKPPMTAYALLNIGKEDLYVVDIADKVYKRSNPDQYPKKVL